MGSGSSDSFRLQSPWKDVQGLIFHVFFDAVFNGDMIIELREWIDRIIDQWQLVCRKVTGKCTARIPAEVHIYTPADKVDLLVDYVFLNITFRPGS